MFLGTPCMIQTDILSVKFLFNRFGTFWIQLQAIALIPRYKNGPIVLSVQRQTFQHRPLVLSVQKTDILVLTSCTFSAETDIIVQTRCTFSAETDIIQTSWLLVKKHTFWHRHFVLSDLVQKQTFQYRQVVLLVQKRTFQYLQVVLSVQKQTFQFRQVAFSDSVQKQTFTIDIFYFQHKARHFSTVKSYFQF